MKSVDDVCAIWASTAIALTIPGLEGGSERLSSSSPTCRPAPYRPKPNGRKNLPWRRQQLLLRPGAGAPPRLPCASAPPRPPCASAPPRPPCASCSVHSHAVTGRVSEVALSRTSCISIESQAAGSDLVVTTPTELLFGLSRLRGTSNKQKLQQNRQRVASQSPWAECGDHACGNLRSCSTGAARKTRKSHRLITCQSNCCQDTHLQPPLARQIQPEIVHGMHLGMRGAA